MKNKIILLDRIAKLASKKGVIKGLALTTALITLLQFSPLLANAEENCTTDSDGRIHFFADDSSDSQPGRDDDNKATKAKFDASAMFDNGILANYSIPNLPALDDLNDENQLNARAQFIYNQYSNLGYMAYSVEDIKNDILIYNGVNPIGREFNDQDVAELMNRLSLVMDYHLIPIGQFFDGVVNSTNEQYLDQAQLPIINYSAYLADNSQLVGLARLMECACNGIINGNGNEEKTYFARLLTAVGLNSIANGEYGYPNILSSDSHSERLFCMVLFYKFAGLAASEFDTTIYIYQTKDGQKFPCTENMESITGKINNQPCPNIPGKDTIFTDAVNGTVIQLSSQDYSIK